MESSKPILSSKDTLIAYIDFKDIQNPEKHKEIIDSLKLMRFLVVTNVPGVKEMQRELYNNIYHFPQMFKENPNSGITSMNNRTALISTMELQEDQSYSFTVGANDTDQLKEYKRLTTEFSKIKTSLIL
jgi:hypothetical protein